MTQLSFPSRPGLQTSAHPLRSLPEHWRTWAGESRLNRVWLNELIVGDLQPMHQQLALLAVALDEAVRVRYAGSARPAVEEAIQQLDLAVLDHQHFLTTLGRYGTPSTNFPPTSACSRGSGGRARLAAIRAGGRCPGARAFPSLRASGLAPAGRCMPVDRHVCGIRRCGRRVRCRRNAALVPDASLASLERPAPSTAQAARLLAAALRRACRDARKRHFLGFARFQR